METWKIKVTVSNILVALQSHVLASFLQIEDFNAAQDAVGAMIGDFSFLMCLEREGFDTIPNIIMNNNWHMRVIVKGRLLVV